MQQDFHEIFVSVTNLLLFNDWTRTQQLLLVSVLPCQGLWEKGPSGSPWPSWEEQTRISWIWTAASVQGAWCPATKGWEGLTRAYLQQMELLVASRWDHTVNTNTRFSFQSCWSFDSLSIQKNPKKDVMSKKKLEKSNNIHGREAKQEILSKWFIFLSFGQLFQFITSFNLLFCSALFHVK